MAWPRRQLALVLAALFVILLLPFLYSSTARKRWRPTSGAGVTELSGRNYTRTLVIAKTKDEDIKWVQEELPGLETAAYVANDLSAPLHTPKNKGHEIMVYLTYIIEHWHQLPDIVIVLHSHRYSWHNNELMDGDAVEMIKRLNNDKVVREGYINLRCSWGNACPDWIHPGNTEKDGIKEEQMYMADAWAVLFPLDPVPEVLATPCCSQFAVSGEAIRSVKLDDWIHYRNWLVATPLEDSISGRIWEHLWHYIFTRQSVHCPEEHICYCDNFGLCFGGKEQYDKYNRKRNKMLDRQRELEKWNAKKQKVDEAKEKGLDEAELKDLEEPEAGRDVELKEDIEWMKELLYSAREVAYERGLDPKNRALEAGRPWREGDGF